MARGINEEVETVIEEAQEITKLDVELKIDKKKTEKDRGRFSVLGSEGWVEVAEMGFSGFKASFGDADRMKGGKENEPCKGRKERI